MFVVWVIGLGVSVSVCNWVVVEGVSGGSVRVYVVDLAETSLGWRIVVDGSWQSVVVGGRTMVRLSLSSCLWSENRQRSS